MCTAVLFLGRDVPSVRTFRKLNQNAHQIIGCRSSSGLGVMLLDAETCVSNPIEALANSRVISNSCSNTPCTIPVAASKAHYPLETTFVETAYDEELEQTVKRNRNWYYADIVNMPTSYQYRVWEREAHTRY